MSMRLTFAWVAPMMIHGSVTAMERNMNTIRIRKKLDSSTLTMPELDALIGKTVKITVEEETPADVEQRFRELKAEWKADTAHHSNPSIIMRHPAMRAIVAMADAVVPVILRDLEAGSGGMGLVWALREITGENIAPPLIENGCAKWSVPEQREAWLQWGREKGLV